MNYRIDFKLRRGGDVGVRGMPIQIECDSIDGALAMAFKKERETAATDQAEIAITITADGKLLLDERQIRSALMSRWQELEQINSHFNE